MERDPPEPFVRLPASSLAALADGCLAMGPSGVDALREAGRRAGFRIFDSLGVLPETLPLARFFEAADRALQACGLGSVDFEAVDGGLIAMSWRRLPEAGGAEAGGRTSRGCPLATGILGGLLTRAAGSPMAVLEVDCAADGGDACWFLVGSEERLREIHGRIAGGASPHAALAPDESDREDGSERGGVER